MTAPPSKTPTDFIRARIVDDLATNRHDGRVVTRFPPEPNGYLHIGHAKSISLNFGLAAEFPGGVCHLRFDDTNPTTEDVEFAKGIERDVKWLGYDWGEHLYYASDYFEQLYDHAVELIKRGHAFVCSQSLEEIREARGTLTEPGTDSPYRTRSVDENLELFAQMRAGVFEDGAHVLRAKIEMASPNMNLRDPILYRIRRASHYRTGDDWCIYPMYDYAHVLSDWIEGVTHSICTLEFEDHRPLYDWVLEALDLERRPQQIEFARLNVSHTVTSKRKLLQLVKEGHVHGWDDPRMPTITALRRRGYTPTAIRAFCDEVGVAKPNGVNDVALLEFIVREELNRTSPRVMGVLDPLRVVIKNYPDDLVEELEAVNNPADEGAGTRLVPFSRVLYIEREDFMEDPPRKFFRLAPGREVRLRYAYYVTCQDVVRDPETGRIEEVRCTYDPETRGGSSPDGRKVKGTLHWVSAEHALPATVRLYDRLFLTEVPGADDRDYLMELNPESLVTLDGCRVEPSLGDAAPGHRIQFERQGYFCVDPDSTAERLVFNRTVALRDSWAKIAKGGTG